MDVRQFMRNQGWSWKEAQRPSGLTAILNCPICGDTEHKFAIKIDDGAFKCLHENRCGIKGSFWDLQKMLGLNPQRLDTDTTIYHQPVKYEKPKIHSDKQTNKAYEYLKSRGIPEAIIAEYRIGQYENDIMFPYFKDGELVNVKYRSTSDKKFRQEKNAEPVLFGRDLCKRDYIILTEGEIDAISYAVYGFDAISIPSGANDTRWIEHEWDYLQKFQKIYISFDNDEAGQKNIDEIVKRLGPWRCYNIILPHKDANECLVKNISDEQIQKAIENAKHFDPPALMKANDFTEDIVFMFEHPEKMYGLSTPWKGLTEILKGWREGELTIWSGRPSSGKSTALNEVIYGLLKKDEKVIIASLEMPPKRYLRWMLMRIKQKQMLERSEIDEAINELNNLFVCNVYGEINPNELINVFNFAARKYGVKHFIIDSLMKIAFPGYNELEQQKNFCNSLIDNLAKLYEGHVHLVAHPRKGLKDSDKLDAVDIYGTSNIANLADNILTMYRVPESEKIKAEKDGDIASDGIIYVKKNREVGTEGHVNLKFFPDSKSFMEI